MDLALGVHDDCVCLSTSEAIAAAALAAGGAAAQPAGDLRDEIPPFHCFLGADARALSRWLMSNKEPLLTRPGWKGRFRQAGEIEAAGEFCGLFRYAGGVATVTPAGLDLRLRLEFQATAP